MKPDPSTDYIETKSPMDVGGGYVSMEETAKAAARDMMSSAERRPAELTDLARRTEEARKALYDALKSTGDCLETFKPLSDQYIREIRSFTTSGVLEFRNLNAALADIRKFFMSDQHLEEVRRLKEFVELCERLKALKDNGFLDTVADTILKLG